MEIFLDNNLDGIKPEDWTELADNSPSRTVFQTYAWHKAWLEIFGNDQPVYIVRLMEGGRLTGVAPLMVTRKGKWRILKFIGQGHSDYCDFLYPSDKPEILMALLEGVNSRRDQWDAMALDGIAQDSPTAVKLPVFCRQRGLFANLYSRQVCPRINLIKDKEYLPNLMQKKSFQRDYRQLMKQGVYQSKQIAQTDEILNHLEDFFNQHILRRQGKLAGSLFQLEKNRLFYRALAGSMDGLNVLLMTVITINQKAVAYHFGFVDGKTLIFYKPSFDIQLSKYSPGDALLMELFRYCQENNLEVFDFSAGEERYKARYANEAKNIVSFKVFKTPAQQLLSRSLDLFKGLRKS